MLTHTHTHIHVSTTPDLLYSNFFINNIVVHFIYVYFQIKQPIKNISCYLSSDDATIKAVTMQRPPLGCNDFSGGYKLLLKAL